MAKLGLQIIAGSDPLEILNQLARQMFNAEMVSEIEGSDTLNIDSGINNIRARITAKNVIEFYHRYDKDYDRYESLILEFCRNNNLTIKLFKTEHHED